MTRRAWRITLASAGLVALFYQTWAIGAGDVISGLRTRFTNVDSIKNTRHNLTQATLPSGGIAMDPYRNNYGQVCVYCHTPHGANTDTAAPLWNRKGVTAAGSFTTYSALGTATLSGVADAPGAASLTCLSCHDGATAIDSILNMPGSGLYNANPDDTFLDTWPLIGFGGVHNTLNQCLSCHQPNAQGGSPAAYDFRVVVMGTDLRNDHPIGIPFPGGDPDSTGFNSNYFSKTQPNGSVVQYYDKDGSGNLSKKDPRFYDNKVECSSCHDPHGVPSGGAGSQFYPTFLRVDAAASAICLTCHAK